MVRTVTAEFWDAHYGRSSQVWSGQPNHWLVNEVERLEPVGRALDLGCGEGADAIWLAACGWSVTAVDVSQTALDRGDAAAAAAGSADRIDWQRHDLTATFPSGTFDLVSAQFLQSPIELPVERVLRSAADAVAVGGTLLVVSHAAPPSWTTDHHHPSGGFPDPVDTAGAVGLDDASVWDLSVCELRKRPTTGPDGAPGLHVDGVLRARRRR